MATEFTIPNLGDGIKGGDVLNVLVKVGDTVARDQNVLELETDKATIEVPSSVAGKVAEVKVKSGDKVAVGQVVLVVEDAAGAQPAAPAAPAEGQAAPPPAAKPEAEAKAKPEADANAKAKAAEAGPAAESTPAADAKPAAAAPASGDGGTTTFDIPNLGDGIKGGDVLNVLVKVGDVVAKDQAVVELETDKATIEVPSSVAGTVTEVKIKKGDKVAVGQAVLTLTGGGAAPAAPAAQPAAPATVSAERVASLDVAPEAQGASPATPPPSFGGKPSGSPAKPGGPAEVVDFARGARPAAAAPAAPPAVDTRPPAAAAPSVRRLARQLGLDIHAVSGTGPGGRISSEDVLAHAKQVITSRPAGGGALPAVALPDFAKWGPIERQSMRAIRRKTAEHMVTSWTTIPHVTQHEKADVTELEALRQKFGKTLEAQSKAKLTVTAVALKVAGAALKAFPQVNASVDMAGEAVILKQYVHVGVAVDTDRGLLVPVIRDVDRKSILELAAELGQLAEKARAGKLTLDEMQGGCFTITNLGGFGGTAFTPIVNQPEAAILGMSRSRMEPVWQDGQFVPRLMLPLSLSYDHRIVDGADGIRFLRYIVDRLEHPFLLSL
jgi:pyruvate dehydrogenase E2 component (dihydrolipoamide acetyltransferase)